MNKCFTNITENFKLKRSPHFCDLNHTLICFQNHTSIIKIASLENSKNDSAPELFDSKETTEKGDTPANVLKNRIRTHLLFLTNIISSCI